MNMTYSLPGVLFIISSIDAVRVGRQVSVFSSDAVMIARHLLNLDIRS